MVFHGQLTLLNREIGIEVTTCYTQCHVPLLLRHRTEQSDHPSSQLSRLDEPGKARNSVLHKCLPTPCRQENSATFSEIAAASTPQYNLYSIVKVAISLALI